MRVAVMQMLVCGALAALLLTGCTTNEPLALSSYTRNVVIHTDGRIFVDERRTDYRYVVRDLRRMGVGDNMPVTLHVARDAAPELFDHIRADLRRHGYDKLRFRVFDEPGGGGK